MKTLLEELLAFEDRLPELLEQDVWTRHVYGGPGNFDLLRYAYVDDEADTAFHIHRTLPPEKPTGEYPRPHRHTLPMIVHVLGGGTYEQGIGHHTNYKAGGPRIEPRQWSRVIVKGEWWYELHEDNAYHYVRALDAPIYSVCGISRVKRPPNPALTVSPKSRPDLFSLVENFFAQRG